MARTAKGVRKPTKGNRTGVPLMLYLTEHQAARIDELSKLRRITKTALVQFAVDRLFLDMSNGQLDLPLGLKASDFSVRKGPLQAE
jgi:hypothetical protein